MPFNSKQTECANKAVQFSIDYHDAIAGDEQFKNLKIRIAEQQMIILGADEYRKCIGDLQMPPAVKPEVKDKKEPAKG